MNWRSIARKDVRDAVRSRSVWLVTGLFLLLFLALTYAVPRIAERSFDAYLRESAAVVVMVVPLVAIVLGYKAVVDERESGSIALLLSLPHSRRDLVVGKFVGRSVVLTVPILASLLVAGAVVTVQYGSFDVARYVGFLALTALYGLPYLALAIGISMTTTSARRVTTAAFGVYLLLVVLWSDLVSLAVMILFRFEQGALQDPPNWATFAEFAEPGSAYTHLVNEALDAGVGPDALAESQPWFVTWWVALALLVAWIVVPLVVGDWRFQRSDL